MATQEKDNSQTKENIQYVDQRYTFARKEEWLKKFFLLFMISFLTLGILGLFGSGPISEQTLSGGSYIIEYNQFLRKDTPSELYISLENPPDTTVISFAVSYLKDVQIKRVTPDPESVEIKDNRLHYSFATNGSGTIFFGIQPDRSGSKELEIGVLGDVRKIKQYVYF